MENLTRECFNAEMETLISLYGYKTTKKQMELYYGFLRRFTESEFKDIIKIIIEKDRFFPAVAVFLKYKSDEIYQNPTDEELFS